MAARKIPVRLRNLFRRPARQDVTVWKVQWWAEQYGMEVVALEPCGMPPPYVLRQIRYTSPPAEHRYFKITAIDADHVRRSGVARVDGGIEIVGGVDQTVQFVWLTSEQLNWRTRPPRRTAELPHDRAQGWYIDPTRGHELRWYSAGTPTDLVKDGAIESRDPPPGGQATP